MMKAVQPVAKIDPCSVLNCPNDRTTGTSMCKSHYMAIATPKAVIEPKKAKPTLPESMRCRSIGCIDPASGGMFCLKHVDVLRDNQ